MKIKTTISILCGIIFSFLIINIFEYTVIYYAKKIDKITLTDIEKNNKIFSDFFIAQIQNTSKNNIAKENLNTNYLLSSIIHNNQEISLQNNTGGTLDNINDTVDKANSIANFNNTRNIVSQNNITENNTTLNNKIQQKISSIDINNTDTIEILKNRGININNLSDINQKINKAQIIAIIMKLRGIYLDGYNVENITFKDIQKEAWYTPYFEIAKKNNWITGDIAEPKKEINTKETADIINKIFNKNIQVNNNSTETTLKFILENIEI